MGGHTARCAALLLIALIGPTLLHCTPLNARSTEGLVALYTFTEGQTNPSATSAADQATGVMGDLTLGSAVWLSNSIGISFANISDRGRSRSELDASELYDLLGATGTFTIEAWFRATSTDRVVFGLDWWTDDVSVKPALECNQSPRPGVIAVHEESCALVDGSSCRSMNVAPTPESNGLTFFHLKRLAGQGYNSSSGQQGGSAVYPFTTVPTTVPWLQLGPKFSNEATPFTGDLFLLAIYDRTLSFFETLANRNAWLNNSRPTVSSHSVSTTEDVATVVTLQATDFDLTSGFAVTDVLAATVTVPSDFIGTVYDMSDAIITARPTFQLTSIQFKYLARPNEAKNNYTSFTFTVNDGVAGSASAGTVTVNVTPVNDPPVATAGSGSVYNKVVSNVTLAGTDADTVTLPNFPGQTSQNIVYATIKSLPAYGTLTTINDVPINSPDTALSGLKLKYLYDGPEVSYVDVIATDTFQFTVTDAGGAESDPAVMTLQIHNYLTASNTTTVVNEDTEIMIIPSAVNRLDPENLVIYVFDLPTRGDLYHVVEGENGTAPGDAVEPDDAITDPLGRVFYIPDLNVNGLEIDSFQFYAAAGGLLTANARQTISITPVNDPPVFTFEYVTSKIDATTQYGAIPSSSFSPLFTGVISDVDGPGRVYVKLEMANFVGSILVSNAFDPTLPTTTLGYSAGNAESGSAIWQFWCNSSLANAILTDVEVQPYGESGDLSSVFVTVYDEITLDFASGDDFEGSLTDYVEIGLYMTASEDGLDEPKGTLETDLVVYGLYAAAGIVGLLFLGCIFLCLHRIFRRTTTTTTKEVITRTTASDGRVIDVDVVTTTNVVEDDRF